MIQRFLPVFKKIEAETIFRKKQADALEPLFQKRAAFVV